MDAFTRAYIEAALWSTSCEEEPRPDRSLLDAGYSVDDIAPETLAQMEKDCAAFQEKARGLIDEDEPNLVPGSTRDEHAGHDFWLTRNRHGAGFWDGDWPKHGDGLTELAKAFGEVWLYVGDDGLIYG